MRNADETGKDVFRRVDLSSLISTLHLCGLPSNILISIEEKSFCSFSCLFHGMNLHSQFHYFSFHHFKRQKSNETIWIIGTEGKNRPSVVQNIRDSNRKDVERIEQAVFLSLPSCIACHFIHLFCLSFIFLSHSHKDQQR